MLVQRDRNEAVTTIPVLIPCSPNEQEGEATFNEFGGPVRRVTQSDFQPHTGKHRKFLGAMREHELQHFAGVIHLLKAIEHRDPVAIAKARKQLSEAHATEARRAEASGWKDSPQLGQLLTPYFGLEAGQGKEALEILSGHRLPPRTAKDDSKVLSLEISRKLALWVDLVLWWSGDRFTPALYCKDPRVAPYVYILTVKRWSVCPHCGEFFTQQRSDQNYCSVAHREAHRVARWRALKVSKTRKRGD